jgi:hypothetical protein
MTGLLAIGDGVVFAIGSVIFIAVFTAAISLAYARFGELGDDQPASRPAEPSD